MNSATVPEIHLHYTKQLFSLNVGLSSVIPPFSILTHLCDAKVRMHLSGYISSQGGIKKSKHPFLAEKLHLHQIFIRVLLSCKLSALMQGISSTTVFLNSSGYTSAKRLWWSHLLPPAQRHAVRCFNSWWIMERAFCISRSDHQSLPLSPPFPRSLVCGIRSTRWAHFQFSVKGSWPASGCLMLSEGRSAPPASFLVRHKFLSLKSKEVLTMKLSVATSKKRDWNCVYGSTL